MQRQEIERSLYQQTHQLPTEDLEDDVLRFVEFVQFKNKRQIDSKTPNQEMIEAMEARPAWGEYERMIYTSNGTLEEVWLVSHDFKTNLTT